MFAFQLCLPAPELFTKKKKIWKALEHKQYKLRIPVKTLGVERQRSPDYRTRTAFDSAGRQRTWVSALVPDGSDRKGVK